MSVDAETAGGAVASALLPQVVHEASAAILVVDLRVGEVTYANELALQLAPGVELPVSVDDWSGAAELEDAGGAGLPQADDDGTHQRSESLLRVAQGEPVLGEAVSAGRASSVTAAREPLWVVGIPMTTAPEPFASTALVAFLPLRNAQLVAGAQQSANALRDRAMLATRVSFTITDPNRPDDPLVWVNPAFTATTGYDFDDAVGRNCRFLQGPRTDRRVVNEIGQSLRAARSITTTLLNYRKDGTTFWNELSVSPILDRSGAVSHFVGVQADVTARVDAQRARDSALMDAQTAAGRLSLLADFATRLTGSLEGDAVVELLADVLVPRLGNWCVVHLRDDSEAGMRSIVRHDRSMDDAMVDRLTTALDEAIAGGLPDADDRSRIAELVGIDSLLVVPLRVRDRILGTVSIVADASRPPFADADLELAHELASRAALMLENSQLYAHQRSASITLQRSLMSSLPTLDGISVAAQYLTATDLAAVGGDWYDVFALRDGAVGITVGDAMGHNFDSAAAMGKLSTMLLAYAWPGDQPGDVLASVDALVTGTRQDYLATCVYGVLRLDEAGGVFEYASAGHPTAVLRRPDGSTRALNGGHGAMLGVAGLREGGGPTRDTARVRVERGSTLIFYTDGLTDSLADSSGDDLDPDAALSRISQLVASAPVDAGAEDLVAVLVEHTGDRRKDDVAVIAVRLD